MLTSRSLWILGLITLTQESCARQRLFGSITTKASEGKIQDALATYNDPVEAMLHLHPEMEDELCESRLLELFYPDGRTSTEWLEEGDKMRLRRQGIGFIDWTDTSNSHAKAAPRTPPIIHESWVKPLFSHLSIPHLQHTLNHLTAYHNRYYKSETGVQSQRWLFDKINDIVRTAPKTCRLSIEQFPHSFPQNSIIARFVPSGRRNASAPVTVIGAHLDSINNEFPLLPAPGADDDGSGTATILEVFRVLVAAGYAPLHGPVEFHWWAGEEAGLLGSQDVARNYLLRGVNVGAVLNLDGVAFVKRNTTAPKINLITVGSTKELNEWTYNLAERYTDIGAKCSGMFGRGQDHQAWTRIGYPAVSIKEGDQTEGGWLPFPHSAMDQLSIPEEIGEYSYEHVLQFARVALAFAVEQGGMLFHD